MAVDSMNKRAAIFLPQDLQDSINTFVEQFNIMEEYNLNTIPSEYTANLLETINRYPEYNTILLDLIDIINQVKK